MRPSRGQTRVEITSPTPPVTTPGSGASGGLGCGALGCLGFLVLLAVLSFLDHVDTPSSNVATLPTPESSVITAPSAPQARYARFEVGKREEGRVEAASVTFQNERLKIQRVSSLDEIPASVRGRANFIGHVSGKAASPDNDATPYVLVGDVSITVGTLSDSDVWSSLMTTDAKGIDSIDARTILNGDHVDLNAPSTAASQVRAHRLLGAYEGYDLRKDGARPPPERVVYVVGAIQTVQTPALTGESRAGIHILDLRVSESERKAYGRAMEEYRSLLGIGRSHIYERDGTPSHLPYDPIRERSREAPHEYHPVEAPHPMAIP